VPALNILVIPLLTSMLHALLVTIIIALTAPALFDGVAPVNWAGFFLVFLVAAFALAGVGALIGVVSTSSRMTVLLSQLVFLPSMILGGLMLPFSLLHGALAKVALILPTTYAMDAFARLAMGQGAASHAWQSVGILLAGGVMAFGLALFLFSWDSKNSTRRGHPALALLAWLPYVIGMLLAT
jgi:ABC-2 type transport system permease protein